MAKTNTIRSNSLQTNSVRLNGVEGLRRVSLQAGEIPDIPPTYTLSASVTNGMVSAKRNGSAVNLPFTANEGDVIVVSVTPNDGYEFNGWNDGNTDNPRTITMTADVALSAQCVEVVQPPVGNYIQFEDKAVEAVLMANNVSSDGVGITMEDAAAVTSISTWFEGNTTIQTFDELQYFTGMTTIPKNAFAGCTNLKSCKISDSVTEIENDAFASSGIESISAKGVETIGAYSFYQCNNLEVMLLRDIESIAGYSNYETFRDCTKLKHFICLAQSVPSLATNVFRGTPINDGTGAIYVLDAKVDAYKSAANWSAFANVIKPYSQLATDNPSLYSEIEKYL